MLFLTINTVAPKSYLPTQGWRLQSSGKLPTPYQFKSAVSGSEKEREKTKSTDLEKELQEEILLTFTYLMINQTLTKHYSLQYEFSE